MKLKIGSNTAKSFNAVIAGLLIGLGVIINTQTKPPILGALLFSFGLLTIIHLKLPLYTGKIGYLKDKLVLILVFNLIGIGITVAAYYIANPQFHELISAAASVKFEKTYAQMLFGGIFCGMLITDTRGLTVSILRQIRSVTRARFCRHIFTDAEMSNAVRISSPCRSRTVFFYATAMLFRRLHRNRHCFHW